MKSIIPILLATSLSGPALGFQVLNQTNDCVYVKEYFHIFNRYNQHIASHETGFCDPATSRCTGQLDFRVIAHSDGSEIQLEEPLCTWTGNAGEGKGHFVITANPAIKPGEKDWCKIKYNPR
jgi:hypothetical protein